MLILLHSMQEKGDFGLQDTSSKWYENAQLTVQWIGHHLMAGKEEANQRRLGSQHFLAICKQEEPA